MSEGRESFADVYDEHIWGVYGFFGYRLRSREEAEDLTQATFERALKAWDRFDPSRASARTWLLAIAGNLLIDHYRRDRSSSQEPIEDPEQLEAYTGRASPPDASLGLEPDLADAIAGLNQREGELIALRYGADLTGPEIAELTGLTLANVQQILSRTLRKLRGHLEGPGSAAAASGGEGPRARDAESGDE